ncbi:response regulator transcription factor [Actinomadura miaoliensis]|uniref:HTH luxR-type domain-containing protein n=1 Tax=Actinomadura miaoliensis TaxID=430685 RepID=A0ABP7VN20_9ACTN
MPTAARRERDGGRGPRSDQAARQLIVAGQRPAAVLARQIRVVAAGDALIVPGVTRRLIAEFARRPEPAPPPAGLTGITDRERQVLTLVGRGLSNAELAAELHISPGTAKTHVASLLAKLGARDRVQLVILAYENGLVSPSR